MDSHMTSTHADDASPIANYFNYFTEIENFYQSRRESFTLISSLDWVLIENWKEKGIPLETVLKGIDRAFSRAKRRINSLAYCVRAVEEVVHEDKEARVERQELPEISQQEIQNYLESLAGKTEVLAEVLPEFAPRIRSIVEAIRTAGLSNFRDAEQTLTALEERLIAILKVAAEESAILEIRRDVDADLAPCRSTMTAEQLTMLEQQLWRRKLMERYNLERLSLFYLI
jgi:GTP1/Obg family GTP-binding protein